MFRQTRDFLSLSLSILNGSAKNAPEGDALGAGQGRPDSVGPSRACPRIPRPPHGNRAPLQEGGRDTVKRQILECLISASANLEADGRMWSEFWISQVGPFPRSEI